MSLQFVVPFVVIGFCYVRIWTFLEYRHSMVTRRSSELDLQRKRRLLRMLVSMVVIFACSWFPFNARMCHPGANRIYYFLVLF
jgi:hypothetical protein